MLQHTLPLAVVFFSNMCMRYIQHSQDYNNKIEVNYTRVLNVNLPWQLSVIIGNWALDIWA